MKHTCTLVQRRCIISMCSRWSKKKEYLSTGTQVLFLYIWWACMCSCPMWAHVFLLGKTECTLGRKHNCSCSAEMRDPRSSGMQIFSVNVNACVLGVHQDNMYTCWARIHIVCAAALNMQSNAITCSGKECNYGDGFPRRLTYVVLCFGRVPPARKQCLHSAKISPCSAHPGHHVKRAQQSRSAVEA